MGVYHFLSHGIWDFVVVNNVRKKLVDVQSTWTTKVIRILGPVKYLRNPMPWYTSFISAISHLFLLKQPKGVDPVYSANYVADNTFPAVNTSATSRVLVFPSWVVTNKRKLCTSNTFILWFYEMTLSWKLRIVCKTSLGLRNIEGENINRFYGTALGQTAQTFNEGNATLHKDKPRGRGCQNLA